MRWRACSAPASWARWAAATFCTVSPPRSRCFAIREHRLNPARRRDAAAGFTPPASTPAPTDGRKTHRERLRVESREPPDGYFGFVTTSSIEQRAINVIRGLAMDAPRAANSGHSGTAMALAPLAHVLWTRILRYDPAHPDWPDRDRFVLSNGHASILLYSLLYLTGFGL